MRHSLLTATTITFLTLTLIVFFDPQSVAGSPSRNDVTDAALGALEMVAEGIAIPDAVAPLVDLAQGADIVALGGTQTYLNKLRQDIFVEILTATPQEEAVLQRKLNTINEMLSQLTGLKNKRTIAEQKAEEDGCDPFSGVFICSTPIIPPGTFALELSKVDSLYATVSGDAPAAPFVGIVSPLFAGADPVSVAVDTAFIEITLSATSNPDSFEVTVNQFGMQLPSFDIAPGTPTGTNLVSIYPFGSAPTGYYDAVTQRFDFRFEGAMINALYSPSNPIRFFHQANGVVLEAEGIVHASGDDPMLVPVPGGVKGIGAATLPKLMAATTMVFDSVLGQVRFVENTDPNLDPDVSMAQSISGDYAFTTTEDSLIGADLSIDPIDFLGVDSIAGRYLFGDADFAVTRGATTYLDGFIHDIYLDAEAGDFFGVMEVIGFDASSPIASEIAASVQSRSVQFCSGAGATDFSALTDSFTVSAEMWWPQVIHLGGKATYVYGDADGNGAVSIGDAVFIINFIFGGGPAPSPLLAADANCDGTVSIGDAVFIINFIFGGGPAPCE